MCSISNAIFFYTKPANPFRAIFNAKTQKKSIFITNIWTARNVQIWMPNRIYSVDSTQKCPPKNEDKPEYIPFRTCKSCDCLFNSIDNLKNSSMRYIKKLTKYCDSEVNYLFRSAKAIRTCLRRKICIDKNHSPMADLLYAGHKFMNDWASLLFFWYRLVELDLVRLNSVATVKWAAIRSTFALLLFCLVRSNLKDCLWRRWKKDTHEPEFVHFLD